MVPAASTDARPAAVHSIVVVLQSGGRNNMALAGYEVRVIWLRLPGFDVGPPKERSGRRPPVRFAHTFGSF